MRHYTLFFYGYTWDDYFYVISQKSGILIVYKGDIDKEGVAKMDEIIYVGEAEEFTSIYESDSIKEIRRKVSPNKKLFYSYAEMGKEGRLDVKNSLKSILTSNDRCKTLTPSLKISCKGACALFPQELLSEL